MLWDISSKKRSLCGSLYWRLRIASLPPLIKGKARAPGFAKVASKGFFQKYPFASVYCAGITPH
ncbi:MAG: hypothetical protein A2252_12750 [Elusimicrobia bacterium RIFOXYA2_FULL_39_19]|nr:MAG: hypothetical protein A2252_12750 [Elusimicrobia bacterium RIFOXYA2_FULL_39_19]